MSFEKHRCRVSMIIDDLSVCPSICQSVFAGLISKDKDKKKTKKRNKDPKTNRAIAEKFFYVLDIDIKPKISEFEMFPLEPF